MLPAVNDVPSPGPSGSTSHHGRGVESLDLRFVQDRLALFAKTLFWFGMTFVTMAIIVAPITQTEFFQPGRESQLLATLSALVLWRVARRPTVLSPRLLHALDAGGTLAICYFVIAMGQRLLTVAPWGFFAGTLAVFHVTTARSIIVPSTPRRTFVITLLAYAPLAVAAQMFPGEQLSWSSPARWQALIGTLAWSTTLTALATLASNVIYGLRAEVAKARQLGQYTLERKIGEGGMGEVYQARHALLRRPTAIKLLAGDTSPDHVRRFEQEVQLTASLTHPNTISIYDFGRTPDGVFYYVMELLDGLTLQEVVERDGAQPASRVVHILLQACGALREAHDAGLIHRDIKPANIFLCRLGGVADTVKVLDFGLVKRMNPGEDPGLSNFNTIVGTPLYLSPEAITTPETLDARSDLYALGAVGYFLLTGAPMFSARTVVEACSQQLHEQPEPVARRARRPVSAELAQIIHDCLAKDPAARPPGAAALAARLNAVPDAHVWTELHAEAWWQRGLEPRAQSEPVEPDAGTVQVDLDGRVADTGQSQRLRSMQ
jgi:eukaryotic-like serine/threonine-protein kinase